MNNTNNPSAFPSTKYGMIISTGMTLRDYFAAKAMQSLLLSSSIDQSHWSDMHARFAYDVADAMLKAREA
jgi:hypothetical protein